MSCFHNFKRGAVLIVPSSERLSRLAAVLHREKHKLAEVQDSECGSWPLMQKDIGELSVYIASINNAACALAVIADKLVFGKNDA